MMNFERDVRHELRESHRDHMDRHDRDSQAAEDGDPNTDFEARLDDVVDRLRNEAKQHRDGGSTENRVKEALDKVFNGGLDATKSGGRHFPDFRITFGGRTFGVEVKGTKALEKFALGNSIMSGNKTDDELDAEDIYLIVVRGVEVFWAKYFDRVVDVGVTHSPRWRLRIDEEVGVDERLFGDLHGQLNLARYGNENFTDEVIDELRRRAIEKGDAAWWVTGGESQPALPLAVKRLVKFTEEKQNDILAKAALLFPGIALGGSTYDPVTIWALTNFGAYVTRDNFSGGGRQPFTEGKCEQDHLYVEVSKSMNSYLGFLTKVKKQVVLDANDLRALDATEDVDDVKSRVKTRLGDLDFEKRIKLIGDDTCSACRAKTELDAVNTIKTAYESAIDHLNLRIE